MRDPVESFRRTILVTAILVTLLSALGWVLAFTVDPDAVNMGLGVGIVALILWGIVIWDRLDY